MFTEGSLRPYPALVKALTGVPAAAFWPLVAEAEAGWAAALAYRRRHVPQAVVGSRFGISRREVPRELRAVLPLLPPAPPCPAVWEPSGDATVPTDGVLPLAQAGDGRVLIDATEQRVSRPSDDATQRRYYSGKKKAHTRKTPLVTDADHHILAIGTAVPGATHDKPLCDARHTLDRLPDGVEALAHKGYQGLAAQVGTAAVCDAANRAEPQRPRMTARTPHKEPRDGALTEAQRRANRALGAVRLRVGHCLGWPKNWAVLATRFRCAHERHTLILRVSFGLVNAQTARWQAAKDASGAYSE